jgi:hypothetical protein
MSEPGNVVTVRPGEVGIPDITKPGPRTGVRVVLHTFWMLLLAVGVELGIGRFGFNPTDQGFILAGSWRILHGETPHVDLISPRPLGSPILHMIDFALPGPLFLMSGLLTMVEIVLTAVALTVVLTGRPVRTWGPLLTGLVAASVVINVNTEPIMAWHTTDGLALTACGWWALDAGLRCGRAWPRCLGLFLLGCAVVTKQSFAPALVIGALWLILHPAARARIHRRLRWLAVPRDLGILVAAPIAYCVVLAATGGWSAAVAQLTGAAPVHDQRLVDFFGWVLRLGPGVLPRIVEVILVVGAVLVLIHLAPLRLDAVVRVLDRLAVVVGAVAVAAVVVAGDLIYSGDWAVALFWIAAIAVVVDTVRGRQLSWRGVTVLALAAMSCLSWGVTAPTPMAGTLALTTLVSLTNGIPPVIWPRTSRVGVAAAIGVLVFTVAAADVATWHARRPYRDVPRGEEIADLGQVAPALAGLRSGPAVLTYLTQLRDCVGTYAAGRVAVLQDNAFVYPALGLRNPFPMDWPTPRELIANSRARMLATIDTLNRTGDYLVLFQTVPSRQLAAGGRVPAAVAPDARLVDLTGLSTTIRNGLRGQHITCGSFAGVWSPRAAS